jgi:DNA-binding CsgD family transcriptional regulator/PAS domain-containing protein
MNENELIDRIYRTVGDPGAWSDVLVGIADHLDATGGMLVYCAPLGKGRTLQVLGRLSEERSAIYRDHYVWNPWSCAMRDVPFGKAVSANSLLEAGAIFKTDFYADVLAPEKQRDILNISHRAMSRDGGVGGFGFSLSARGAERAPANVRRLQRLSPHLCRALDTTIELGRIAEGPQKLAAVLNIMPSAALLLDNRQHIVHANPAAERLLRANDGLTCATNGGLQLSAVLPDEGRALARGLAQALRVADGSSDLLREPLRVTRLSGAGPLLVVPVPLPPPAFSLWELTDTARLLVLVIDPAARNLVAATALQTAFGLTPAEARVATLIGSGLSGPRAAQVLGVSPTTVKTHLARCFEKLGIRSQVELARMLSALPTEPSMFNGTD